VAFEDRSQDSLRVVFAGGTTGGHLMPGAATAEALKMLLPSSRCLFLATDRKAERHCRGAIAPFEVAAVPATPANGLAARLLFPFRALRAADRARAVIRAFRPHVVAGLGGHNCVVPLLVGKLLGVRSAVFESNAMPGRAVRFVAPWVDLAVLQWPIKPADLRARRVLVAGNPVRRSLFGVARKAAARRLGVSPDRCTLLALGGSQGALVLNQALYGALRIIRAKGADLQVIHLTGVDHLPAALEEQANSSSSYRPIGFLERMEDAYAAADFVLARAGASTLAELTALGLPSILVPYPYAGSHQQANAAVLTQDGAAVSVNQTELTGGRLAALIQEFALDPRRRRLMAERARRLGRPQAALTVAAELAELGGFGHVASFSPQQQEEIQNQFLRAA